VRRRLAVAATAVAALLAGAGRAGAQEPLPASEALSANVQAFINNNWDPAKYLTVMRDAGWSGARGDAFWQRVQPADGPIDWSSFDALKARYEAGGVRWQPILEGSPGWARNTTGNSLALPSADHVADFAAFAKAFAARYGPGGPMAGALPVTDIELYNEENARGAGAYTPDPGTYASLYQAARAAIHEAQPGIRVIVGAILYDSQPATAGDPTPTDAEYIKGIFAALGRSGADAIALHPYAPTAIGVAANLRRMHQGLAEAGQPGLPIYVNELGYPAALDGATPKLHAAEGATTDEARAGTLTLLTDALLASDCNIRNIAYFDLVNQENNRADTDYLSSETWKGLERLGDASLTLTGAAFRDAGVRWRAAPSPGAVRLCGPDAAPSSPLALDLRVERPTAGCLRPTVTYRGFPVEEATVVVRKPDGKQSSLLTDATGRLARDFCPDDPVTYTVQAEVGYAPLGVPRLAASSALSCRVGTTAACVPAAGGGLPGGGGSAGGGGSGTVPVAAVCLPTSFGVVGSTRLATVLRRGLRLRALGCRTTPGGTRPSAVARLRVTARVARAQARRLGLARARRGGAVTVGSAVRQLAGGRTVTVLVRFTRRARSRLIRAKRLRILLAVAATQGSRRRSATLAVTLRR
jgi:hypothetical protein